MSGRARVRWAVVGAIGALLVACSGSQVGVGDDRPSDGDIRRVDDGDGGGDGAVNPGTCPASPPLGQQCSLPSSVGCKYARCTYCTCQNGTWWCEAPGCASLPSQLVLEVVDAQTGQPVADPTFTNAGQALSMTCAQSSLDAGAPDGGRLCAEWRYYGSGHFEITIASPGYASQTLIVDVPAPKGECCYIGETVRRKVSLTK